MGNTLCRPKRPDPALPQVPAGTLRRGRGSSCGSLKTLRSDEVTCCDGANTLTPPLKYDGIEHPLKAATHEDAAASCSQATCGLPTQIIHFPEKHHQGTVRKPAFWRRLFTCASQVHEETKLDKKPKKFRLFQKKFVPGNLRRSKTISRLNEVTELVDEPSAITQAVESDSVLAVELESELTVGSESELEEKIEMEPAAESQSELASDSEYQFAVEMESEQAMDSQSDLVAESESEEVVVMDSEQVEEIETEPFLSQAVESDPVLAVELESELTVGSESELEEKIEMEPAAESQSELASDSEYQFAVEMESEQRMDSQSDLVAESESEELVVMDSEQVEEIETEPFLSIPNSETQTVLCDVPLRGDVEHRMAQGAWGSLITEVRGELKSVVRSNRKQAVRMELEPILMILSGETRRLIDSAGFCMALEHQTELSPIGCHLANHGTRKMIEAKITARSWHSMGIMRLLGDLFKRDMVEERFMHSCIVSLLDTRDDTALECLCCLLFNIGGKIDTYRAKNHVDEYMRQMERILERGKISYRIRFMIQWIMDLRQNNWAPRNRNQGPKAITQVHREAELEPQQVRDEVGQQLVHKTADTQPGHGEHRASSRAQRWSCREHQGQAQNRRRNYGEHRGPAQEQRLYHAEHQGHHGERAKDQKWYHQEYRGPAQEQRWHHWDHHGQQQHPKLHHGEQQGRIHDQKWYHRQHQGQAQDRGWYHGEHRNHAQDQKRYLWEHHGQGPHQSLYPREHHGHVQDRGWYHGEHRNHAQDQKRYLWEHHGQGPHQRLYPREHHGHVQDRRWCQKEDPGHNQDLKWYHGQYRGHAQDQGWSQGKRQGSAHGQKWYHPEHRDHYPDQRQFHGDRQGHTQGQRWYREEPSDNLCFKPRKLGEVRRFAPNEKPLLPFGAERSFPTHFSPHKNSARKKLSALDKKLPAHSRLLVCDWSEEDVCAWLCAEGLESLVDPFRANNIDGGELISLTKDTLAAEMNIDSVGLRNKVIRKIEELKMSLVCTGVPDEFLHPITREVMKDPVIAADGFSYEREAIESWINSKNRSSPMTNLPLQTTVLTPNRTLKMAIGRWKSSQ